MGKFSFRNLTPLLLLMVLLAACGEAEQTLAPTAASSPSPRPPSPIPATLTQGPPQPVPVLPVMGLPQGSEGFPWWNDAVFYEIFVRSFYDSDGDGQGDFNGIIQKLDYLNDGDPATTSDLGVSGIWLMPIFPSPSYHGYDATDTYSVNPDYGTLDDFKLLLEEAHQRGIRVIIDLMLNHTSVEHPWFQASQDPNSPYRNWYVWSENDPGTLGPTEQQAWHASPSGGFYYSVFAKDMADLNYNNPEITAEMEKVVRFWLQEVGVDGFRLDGARYLVEEENQLADTASNHTWFKEFRTFYKGVNSQAMTVGEVWTSSFAVATYLKGDQLDTAFNFDLASAFISSAGSETASRAQDQLKLDTKSINRGQWAPFLTNHDMDRVMTQLGEDAEKAKNAAALLMTAPGVPFIYYGEEIGMTGGKPDERIRTPMQWSSDAHAGFSTVTPWEPVNPDFRQKNVASQSKDADSLLAYYRALIHLRNQHIALRVGQPALVKCEHKAIYAILRASQDETILALTNLSKDPVSDCTLALDSGPLSGSYRVVPLLGEGEFPDLAANAQGGFEAYQPMPTIPANTTIILQLQK